MINIKETNKWILGATGYVGQLVTHRLFTERTKGNWSGQLITLGQKNHSTMDNGKNQFSSLSIECHPGILL